MPGGRRRLPASKATVVVFGLALTCLGALLSAAVLIGERAPEAPVWALVLAPVITLGGLACGLYILINGLRMR